MSSKCCHNTAKSGFACAFPTAHFPHIRQTRLDRVLVQERHQRQGAKEAARGGSQLSGFPVHFQTLEILTRGLFFKLHVHEAEEVIQFPH